MTMLLQRAAIPKGMSREAQLHRTSRKSRNASKWMASEVAETMDVLVTIVGLTRQANNKSKTEREAHEIVY